MNICTPGRNTESKIGKVKRSIQSIFHWLCWLCNQFGSRIWNRRGFTHLSPSRGLQLSHCFMSIYRLLHEHCHCFTFIVSIKDCECFITFFHWLYTETPQVFLKKKKKRSWQCTYGKNILSTAALRLPPYKHWGTLSLKLSSKWHAYLKNVQHLVSLICNYILKSQWILPTSRMHLQMDTQLGG